MCRISYPCRHGEATGTLRPHSPPCSEAGQEGRGPSLGLESREDMMTVSVLCVDGEGYSVFKCRSLWLCYQFCIMRNKSSPRFCFVLLVNGLFFYFLRVMVHLLAGSCDCIMDLTC